MPEPLLHIGFRNYVPTGRIIAVMSPDSSPVRRMIQQAKGERLIVDMTRGRKTKTVLVMDSGHVVLAAVATETIAGRMANHRTAKGTTNDREPDED